MCVGLEMLTPVFPHHFLIFATLANVAKSISQAAYLATSVRTSTCISRETVSQMLGSQYSSKDFFQLLIQVGSMTASLSVETCECQLLQGQFVLFVYSLIYAL